MERNHLGERNQGLAATLREVIERADKAKADPADTPTFHDIFSMAVPAIDMSHREIADALHVSRSAVTRWANKVSAPSIALRPWIYDWLKDRANRRLRYLRSYGEVEQQAGA